MLIATTKLITWEPGFDDAPSGSRDDGGPALGRGSGPTFRPRGAIVIGSVASPVDAASRHAARGFGRSAPRSVDRG